MSKDSWLSGQNMNRDEIYSSQVPAGTLLLRSNFSLTLNLYAKTSSSKRRCVHKFLITPDSSDSPKQGCGVGRFSGATPTPYSEQVFTSLRRTLGEKKPQRYLGVAPQVWSWQLLTAALLRSNFKWNIDFIFGATLEYSYSGSNSKFNLNRWTESIWFELSLVT